MLCAADRQKTYLVGFAQDNLANDWRMAQVKDVEKALQKTPFIRFIYTDGKGKTSKQISDIENLIALGVDVLITSPMDEKIFAPVLKKAQEQNIPVVLLTRKVKNGYFTTFIHPDDRDIARRAARFISQKLKGKGRILMLQGLPTSSTAIDRTEAFLDEIKKHDGLEIVAIKTANYLRPDAIKATELFLHEGRGFDAIFAQSDSMATGAILALKKAGIDPADIVITGIDYIQEARKAIKKGEQQATFLYPTCGAEGARSVLKIIRGEKVPREVIVPSRLITQDNVDTVEPIF